MTKARGALITIIILFLMIPLSSCPRDDKDPEYTGKVGVWSDKIDITGPLEQTINIISCTVTPSDVAECQIVHELVGGVKFKCNKSGECEVTIVYKDTNGRHEVTKKIKCEN